MAEGFSIQFNHSEQFAFYFEDTQMLMIRFERDEYRLWFVMEDGTEDGAILEYPGDLFAERIRDQVETIFFVELTETGNEPKRMALGAFFPSGEFFYGAYYERGQSAHTLYFLRVIGDGPTASLEAVEDDAEHTRVAEAFYDRYQGIFSVNS